MHLTSVWAFEPIPELNGQLGFVSVMEDVARELIAAGKVQDPRAGGLTLKNRQVVASTPAPVPTPDPVPEQNYSNKEMTKKGVR